MLERIETYYDAVPRSNADAFDLGPFTLFVSRGGWPYYARPRLRHDGPHATTADVEAVRARQRELIVPETFEWVDETSPGLIDLIATTSLAVERLPLLVLAESSQRRSPAGVSVRVVDPNDPDLARIKAAVHVGFATSGTAVGQAGVPERDKLAADTTPERLATLIERLRRGLTVMVVADDESGPLAAGSHQPVGGVTEIVGVATLPSARRRGLGAAITAALVDDARRRGVDTVFLSAGSDAVARVYESVGFRRIATACIAAPPTDQRGDP